MADDHLFIASGDACPICSTLNGTLVSAGFTAHDNCLCQTIPRKDSDDTCYFDVSESHVTRTGNGPMDASVGFEVYVWCPDGSSYGASGEVDFSQFDTDDANADMDNSLAALDAAIEEVAQELCDTCPKKEPFLCC